MSRSYRGTREEPRTVQDQLYEKAKFEFQHNINVPRKAPFKFRHPVWSTVRRAVVAAAILLPPAATADVVAAPADPVIVPAELAATAVNIAITASRRMRGYSDGINAQMHRIYAQDKYGEVHDVNSTVAYREDTPSQRRPRYQELGYNAISAAYPEQQ